MGHRSQASEACHLTVIETAQFRHVDEQAQSCGLGNAGNAHEDRQSWGQIRILHVQALEVRFNGGELVSDLTQPLRKLTPQQGRAYDLLSVERGRAILDQRLSIGKR
jgi:hypothetical protein